MSDWRTDIKMTRAEELAQELFKANKRIADLERQRDELVGYLKVIERVCASAENGTNEVTITLQIQGVRGIREAIAKVEKDDE